MTATKLCERCGPIDFPHTRTTCPVCGGELAAYPNLVELALDMGKRRPAVQRLNDRQAARTLFEHLEQR